MMQRLFVEKFVAAHLDIMLINGTAQVTSGRSRCNATAGCKDARFRRLGDIGQNMFVFGTCCGGRDAASRWIRHIMCSAALRGDVGHDIRWRHHLILFAAVPAGTCTCGGLREMSGHCGPCGPGFCRFESAADACRPCQKYNIMARFMAQSLVLPLPRAVAECATRNESENESRSGQHSQFMPR